MLKNDKIQESKYVNLKIKDITGGWNGFKIQNTILYYFNNNFP